MLLIRNDCTDPAFNLAAEEYLLTTAREPLCMLWRNEKAVIVGKNQNTLGEIDLDYVRSRGIRVVRRMTGGGAVFHDLGNINYTLIEPESGGHFNNYAWFTADLIDFLAAQGVRAELSGRNDVLIGGKKCCGNAQCVKNGWIMHHGCVLFDADLTALTGALKVNRHKLASRGIPSVASRVTNICEHMTGDMSAAAFFDAFAQYIAKKHGCAECVFTPEDKASIRQLTARKYATWEWNYGTSPDYNFANTQQFGFGLVEVRLFISGGVVRQAHISGDFFGRHDLAQLTAALEGVRHSEEAIDAALAEVDVDAFISGCTREELQRLLLYA